MSPPRIDPPGDCTVELFKAAERLRSGSGAALQARAVVLDSPPGSPSARTGDHDLDALAEDRVQLAVLYCSGRERYAKLGAGASLVPLSPELEVGPQYGLAVLKSARPEGRCWR